MRKINLLLFAGFFSLNLMAQHNYDNQSVIYSNNGNVGIGTTNSESKLEVQGSGTIGGKWLPSNSFLKVSDGSGSLIFDTNEIYSSGMLHFGSKTGDIAIFRTIDENGNDDKMIIKNNGNVGIGTINPESMLEVQGSGTIGGKWLPSNSFLKVSDGSGSLIFDTNEIYSSGTLYFGSKTGDIAIFRTIDENGNDDKMIIKNNGSVGIGTTSIGTHKLAVEGSIGAREIRVEVGAWSDFVFNTNYDLPTLDEVENHIKENGHLKDIPSEADVKTNGINLGEMDAKLLQKIEELTLYVIDLQKQINKLKNDKK